MITHQGTPAGGHYVATAETSIGTYCLFNDTFLSATFFMAKFLLINLVSRGLTIRIFARFRRHLRILFLIPMHILLFSQMEQVKSKCEFSINFGLPKLLKMPQSLKLTKICGHCHTLVKIGRLLICRGSYL